MAAETSPVLLVRGDAPVRRDHYDRAILIGIGLESIGRENGEAPVRETGWCGLRTRGRAIDVDPV